MIAPIGHAHATSTACGAELDELGRRLDITAWAALADERSVALWPQLAEGVDAFATPGRLEQVLDNLLANALDVSPPEATISVTAAAVDGWSSCTSRTRDPG